MKCLLRGRAILQCLFLGKIRCSTDLIQKFRDAFPPAWQRLKTLPEKASLNFLQAGLPFLFISAGGDEGSS